MRSYHNGSSSSTQYNQTNRNSSVNNSNYSTRSTLVSSSNTSGYSRSVQQLHPQQTTSTTWSPSWGRYQNQGPPGSGRHHPSSSSSSTTSSVTIAPYSLHDLSPLTLVADEQVMYPTNNVSTHNLNDLALQLTGLGPQHQSSIHPQGHHQHRLLMTQSQHQSSLQTPHTMAVSPIRRPSTTTTSQPTHKPGMKDVPYWLKTLRLHKYTSMVAEMSYYEMMALDEDALEARGVTKGARRKILQSIGKLRLRPTNVRKLEATFDHLDLACLRCAIVELRQLVATPILGYKAPEGVNMTEDEIDGVCAIDEIPDENLPALMMRLLMRVFAMGVAGEMPHEQMKPELLLMYFTICDRMLMNEAFTSSQKRRIVQWRRAARRFAAPADLRRSFLPHPPPPRCDACTPVSTFYFNDNLEDILRVQNLQRLVKQYLQSSDSWDQQSSQTQQTQSQQSLPTPLVSSYNYSTPNDSVSPRQREAAQYGQAMAQAYSVRPSALSRKLYPRGGPVVHPSFSQQHAAAAAYAQQQHHIAAAAAIAAVQAAQAETAATQRSTTTTTTTAAPTTIPSRSSAFRSHQDMRYEKNEQQTTPSTMNISSQSSNQQWKWPGVYSSRDVLELVQLDNISFPQMSNIWSNQFARHQQQQAERAASGADSNTSGYSSGSSERGSGAGSPRAAGDNSIPPRSPHSPEPFVNNSSLVFDFNSNSSDPLDSTCRAIQEQLNFRL